MLYDRGEGFVKDDRIFTFSMHGAKNYPYHKEQSNLDVPLPDCIEDKEYLSILERHINELFNQVEPEFVFFQSGVDVIKGDKLGRMHLSIDGCKRRDQMVFELCHKNKVPIAVNMGGGYSPQIRHILEAHANTFRMAAYYFD